MPSRSASAADLSSPSAQALGRSEFWFHKWWRRYLESGAEGLYDLTHATHHVAQRISPELERSYPLHPPPAAGPRLAGYSLPPHRGPGHLGRTQGPRHPPASQPAHHRARAPAQRLDRAAGPPRPAAATSGVPRPAGPSLQRTPRGRSRRAGLPQGQRPPLLHLGGQGCLRRGRLPAPGRFAPHGRGPLVPRRVLEGPGHGPSRSSSTTPASWPAGGRRRAPCRG